MDALVEALSTGASSRRPSPARSAIRSTPRSGSRRRPTGCSASSRWREPPDSLLLGVTRRDPLRASTQRHRGAHRCWRSTPAPIAWSCASVAARRTTAASAWHRRSGRASSTRRERPIADGGAALAALARIDLSALHTGLARVSVTGACDVDNPLTGPSGASAVYGPQKGASRRRCRDARPCARAAGDGASRETSASTSATSPAPERPGDSGSGSWRSAARTFALVCEVVMEAVGLADRIVGADLVITGEGSLDEQSLHGKVPAGVLDACRLAGAPVGDRLRACERSSPGVPVVSLVDRVGAQAALADARAALIDAADDMAASRRRAHRGAAMSGAIERFTEAAAALGLHPDSPSVPGRHEDRSRRRSRDRVRGRSDREVARLHGRRCRRARAHGGLEPGRRGEAGRGRGRARCRRATPEEARTATGFAVGGTPPFGHPNRSGPSSTRICSLTTWSGRPPARPTPSSRSRPRISSG